jgi:hypothetical protein
MSTSTVPPTDLDLDGLLQTARDLFDLSGSSWEQFRRYVTEHVVWCGQHNVALPVAANDLAAFRAHLERSGRVTTERHWRVRSVSLNKLPRILEELGRRSALAQATRRTRHIDALPANSVLAAAVRRVLAPARGNYLRSLRCDLALLLDWCHNHDIDPSGLDLRSVSAFDGWLRTSGRRSRGPRFVARRLVRELGAGGGSRWWQ